MDLFRRLRFGHGEENELTWSWYAGLHVFVDAQLCFRFIGYESGPDGRYTLLSNAYQRFSGHVRCDKPIRGRHVRLEKAPYPFVDNRPKGYQAHFNQLQLCELQVGVCDLGTYADHDKQFCRKCESSCKHPCDNYHGCREPVPYNVAIFKKATQSATRNGGEAQYRVDGFGAILVDSPNSKRVETGPHPDTGETWWRVDLGGLFNISHIILTTAEEVLGSDCPEFDCDASRDTTDSPGLTLQNKVAIGLAVSLASSLGAVGVYFRYVGECAGCTYLPYIFFSGAESSGDSAQKTATSQSGRSSSTAAADAGGSVHRKADRKAGRDAGGTRGAVAPDETGTRDGSAEAAVAVMEDEEEDKACRVQVSPDEVRVIAG